MSLATNRPIESDISVIICYFRRPKLVRETIESVLNQSQRPREVLFIDDGSGDGIVNTIEQFPSIRYHQHSNRGLAASRNVGIELSTGKRILFLDDDDLLHENALEMLGKLGDDSVTVGALACQEFSHRVGDRSLVHRFQTDQCWLPQLLLKTLPVHSYLLPKALLKAVDGFDESLHHSEDWDLWLRMAIAGGKLNYRDDVGGFYRQHANTMSGNRCGMTYARAIILCKVFQQFRHREAFWDAWAPTFHRSCWAAQRHLEYCSRLGNDENSDQNAVLERLENVAKSLCERSIGLDSTAPLTVKLLHQLSGKPGSKYAKFFNHALARLEHLSGWIA